MLWWTGNRNSRCPQGQNSYHDDSGSGNYLLRIVGNNSPSASISALPSSTILGGAVTGHPSETNSSGSGSALSKGAIAGIVIGILVGLLTLAALLFAWRTKKRRNKQENVPEISAVDEGTEERPAFSRSTEVGVPLKSIPQTNVQNPNAGVQAYTQVRENQTGVSELDSRPRHEIGSK